MEEMWRAFVTGLFAGGASCAVVQGGLLAGMVARRRGDPTSGRKAAAEARGRTAKRRDVAPEPRSGDRRLDLLPVTGFLGGKFASHVLLGAALGALGSAVQLSFRVRAILQIFAGVVMIVLAADLLGFTAARRLLPQPPARFVRLVRRGTKTEAMAGPAILGSLTILIPCGVTLGVMVLAVASGSPIRGASMMGAFVLGTSPLFAILGYAARRSATAFRGRMTKVAAIAVVIVGSITLNTGLVLAGSPVTLSSALSVFGGPGSSATTTPTDATIASDGTQQIVIEARDRSYVPSRIRAGSGVRTTLTMRTAGTRGCTRAFIIPSMGIQKVLPETGDTDIDLGVSRAGRIDYTCGMGMYGGVIEVV